MNEILTTGSNVDILPTPSVDLGSAVEAWEIECRVDGRNSCWCSQLDEPNLECQELNVRKPRAKRKTALIGYTQIQVLM